MKLKPRSIIAHLAAALPRNLAKESFVAGSVAAGFHFEARLERREIRTKDADIVVHTVGTHADLGRRTEELLARGWRWNLSKKFSPGSAKTRAEDLPFIRLFPPAMKGFFIEFLGLPSIGQRRTKAHERVVVHGTHYAIPIFRFAGLLSWDLLDTGLGLKYADPAMMCLANLLSHPKLGTIRMETEIGGRLCLRSAKDLGRVLAIARLTPRDEIRSWTDRWVEALNYWFPRDWRRLGKSASQGLDALLRNHSALLEAHHTATHLGLLPGLRVTPEEFAENVAVLKNDVLGPLLERCGRA